MYNELYRVVRDVDWFGARFPLSNAPWIPYPPLSEYKHADQENAWAECVLERLGIPMYFSENDGGAVYIAGKGDKSFDDSRLTIPYHFLDEREYALRPVADIAPERKHPKLGHTPREMLERVTTKK